MKHEILIKIWILLELFLSLETVVVLRNNGYEGLIIAIHPSVQENPNLVQNIKALMTSASAVLYKATNQRAFFRDVTIFVPPNWSPAYPPTRGGHRFGAAEIRIDHPNPEYGNNPYTLQPGGCGEAGVYIHLTPEFILDLHGTITEEFGDPGKTLVHEWAHLRYGVFDEYGAWEDYRTPPFYIDDSGEVQVTGCGADKIEGELTSPEGGPCVDPHNCMFKVDYDATVSKSSLMYLHFLPMADGFCGSSPDKPHNSAAPNKQNLLCMGKSAWDVIKMHQDFADGRNPSRVNVDTRPNFRIFQPKMAEGGTCILLLDVSGSMTAGRMNMLRRSAARFIKEQIPEGSQLGVVAFSSRPRVLSNITLITTESRTRLINLLPTKDDGGNTGIGAGLSTAVQMLNDSGVDTDGCTIILISDGEENVSPYVQKVIPDLVASRVITNTVAFGKLASSQLENLVKMTGGRGFFYANENGDFPQHDTTLESAFFASASMQADVDFRPVEILNKLEIIDAGKTTKGFVDVEDNLRKNLRFNFGYAMARHLSVALVSPQGETVTANSEFFKQDPISKTFTFQLPIAAVGHWRYQITNGKRGTKQGVGVNVLAEPTDIKQQPIRIRAWINEVQVQYPQDVGRTKVFAEVFKSYIPVLDALVVAVVERPMGSPIELLLRDDGIGPDVAADDGIYSAYFSQFNGTGRYSITARVINDGRAHMKMRELDELPHQGSTAALSKTQFVRNQRYRTERHSDQLLLGQFQRTANAGSFRLTNWSAKDVISPGRVTDLRVIQTSASGALTLRWTSPGDDMNYGNATVLEVRLHHHATQFAASFELGILVNESHLIDGTLNPLPGGDIQDLCIRVDDASLHDRNLYFALRAYDDVGNCGEVSNLASFKPTQFLDPSASSLLVSENYLIAGIATICILLITLSATLYWLYVRLTGVQIQLSIQFP